MNRKIKYNAINTIVIRHHHWALSVQIYSNKKLPKMTIHTSVEVHSKVAVSVAIDDGVDEFLPFGTHSLDAEYWRVYGRVLWDLNLSLLGLKHRAGAVNHVDGNLYRGWQRRCAWNWTQRSRLVGYSSVILQNTAKLKPVIPSQWQSTKTISHNTNFAYFLFSPLIAALP